MQVNGVYTGNICKNHVPTNYIQEKRILKDPSLNIYVICEKNCTYQIILSELS